MPYLPYNGVATAVYPNYTRMRQVQILVFPDLNKMSQEN